MNSRHLIACALLAFSASAIAEAHGLLQESLKDCDKNQLAMNVCASYRFELADKALNQQYKQTLKALQDAAAQKRSAHGLYSATRIVLPIPARAKSLDRSGPCCISLVWKNIRCAGSKI